MILVGRSDRSKRSSFHKVSVISFQVNGSEDVLREGGRTTFKG